MNKITLIGNLAADPEVRSTQSGVTVCTFTLAVTRKYAPQGEERQTDFFRINAWRQLGDNCARFLAKGKKAAVVGELQARTYEAKDGSTRMSLDVSADEVEFLSPRGEQDSGQATRSKKNTEEPDDNWMDVSSDDIPF